MQNKQTYSLKELCREAGVTERTVRYYIQEGLLAPPDGAGPFARYPEQHLLRLRLIRRLKAEYLPLAEIRRRMADLDPQELETLAQQTVTDKAGGEYDEQEADAKNYLDRLLSRRQYTQPASEPVIVPGAPAPSGQNFNWPAAPAAPVPAPAGALPNRRVAKQMPASATRPEAETWQRVIIAPDVELQYKVTNAEQLQKVTRLLEQAHQIFGNS